MQPARRSRKRGWSLDRITLILFVAVPLFFYMIWVWGPTAATIALSFTHFDGITSPTFNGLTNYVRLAQDPQFHQALFNNLIWLFAFLTLPLAGGLALAVALDRKIRFSRFYQSAIYLPMVLALPVIALMFQWFFLPSDGLVNTILHALSNNRLSPGWLADPHLALSTILIAAIWRQVGYVMILYLAGLKGIDPAMREAAYIDGAGEWKLFRNVTFPLLRPVTIIVLVISVIEALRAFDLVWVMTGQEPGYAEVLATLMYREAIHNYEAGYGSAVAVALFLISLGFIITYLIRQLRTEEEL